MQKFFEEEVVFERHFSSPEVFLKKDQVVFIAGQKKPHIFVYEAGESLLS